MIEGYTRRSTTAVDTQPVNIVAVDLPTRTAQASTRVGTTIAVDCSYAVGGHLVTPSVGDQWYVTRVDMVWRLTQKIPFNDDNLLIEPQEGQVVVGGSGPIELNGSQVNIHSGMRINGTLYRDANGVLESSPDIDPPIWTPVSSPSFLIDADGFFILGDATIDADGFYDVAELLIQQQIMATHLT